MDKKVDGKNHHIKLSNVITKHMLSNMQILGIYNGVIITPTGAIPDPLNGPKKFKLSMCVVNGRTIQRAAKVSSAFWYKSICMQINTSTISRPTDNYNMVMISPSKVFTSITPSRYNIKDQGFQSSWSVLSKRLINDIRSGIVFSAPIPATSVSGGIGTVAFTKIN